MEAPSAPPNGNPSNGAHGTALLRRYVNFISAIAYVAGLAAVLALPGLAQKLYVDENALLPGAAAPAFGQQEALDVEGLAAEVQKIVESSEDGYRAVRDWLHGHVSAMEADCYFHAFRSVPSLLATSANSSPQFLTWIRSTFPFFLKFENFRTRDSTASNSRRIQDDSEINCYPKNLGVNVVGIVRAPKGVGDEAMVMITPLKLSENFDKKKFQISNSDAFTLGIGMSVFRIFSAAQWLARDVIWLVADARFGADVAVSHWLRDYHEPQEGVGNSVEFERISFCGQKVPKDAKKKASLDEPLDERDRRLWEFQRGGMISAGIVFEVDRNWRAGGLEGFQIRAEGPNGQLPNLDLIALMEKMSSWQERLNAELDKWAGVENFWAVRGLGLAIDFISGQVLGALNPQWKLKISGQEFCAQTAALLKFMANQAVSIPSGPHGPFRNFQIDAISVTAVGTGPCPPSRAEENFAQYRNARLWSVYKIGRTLESSFRCLNNLLEKFHHSHFFYLLSSPTRFVPLSTYIVPFLLLLLPLLLQAASLSSSQHEPPSPSPSPPSASPPDPPSSPPPPNTGKISNSRFTEPENSQNLTDSEEFLTIKMLNSDWINAIFVVGGMHFWGFLVALAPPLVATLTVTMERVVTWNPKKLAVFIWLGFLGFSFWGVRIIVDLFLKMSTFRVPKKSEIRKEVTECGTENSKNFTDYGFYGHMETGGGGGGGWKLEKAAMLGSLIISISALSCLNFSLSLISEIVLVPLTLLLNPISSISVFSILGFGTQPRKGGRRGLIWYVLVPIGLGIGSWGVLYGGEGLGFLWESIEMHFQLGTALYFHLTVIVLPWCSMFLRILFQ